MKKFKGLTFCGLIAYVLSSKKAYKRLVKLALLAAVFWHLEKPELLMIAGSVFRLW